MWITRRQSHSAINDLWILYFWLFLSNIHCSPLVHKTNNPPPYHSEHSSAPKPSVTSTLIVLFTLNMQSLTSLLFFVQFLPFLTSAAPAKPTPTGPAPNDRPAGPTPGANQFVRPSPYLLTQHSQ